MLCTRLNMRLTRVAKQKKTSWKTVAKRRAEKDKSPEEDAKPKTILTVQVDGQAYRVTVAYGDAELLAALLRVLPLLRQERVKKYFLRWKASSS